MPTSVPSHGRRLLGTFGVALAQALLLGGAVGFLVALRPARPATDPDAPSTFLRELRSPLAAFERDLYDWRARELGRDSHPSPSVVLVGIDDETLANARSDPHERVATSPWPRALVGKLSNLLLEQGASQVVVDLPFSGLSPHGAADDHAYREDLASRPGRTVLGFSWTEDPLPPVATWLYAFRVKLSTSADRAAALDAVRKVLVARKPAYLIPHGSEWEVWAGARSEDAAQAIAARWNVAAPEIRELTADDRAHQITPTDLFVASSEVKVQGLDPTRLPRIRNLIQPAAPLLVSTAGYGSVTFSPDPDGEVRGFYQLVDYAPTGGVHHLLPSAPLAAAMALAHTRSLRWSKGRLYVGDAFSIPMDRTGFSLIRWDAAAAALDPRGSLQRAIPAWHVLVDLFDSKSGAPPHYHYDVKGKTVVLADATRHSPDALSTPIGDLVPRGAVVGQALANLLSSSGIRRAARRVDFESTLALAILGGLLALGLSGLLRSAFGAAVYLGAFAALAAVFLWFSRHLFVVDHLWLATAGPLVAYGLTFVFASRTRMRSDREVQDFIQAALGRYVSPEVSRAVFRHPKLIRPAKRMISILCCDLDGFTKACEELPPEGVAGMLEAFLSEATAAVRETSGQVEYVGDALLALWGAPVRTERHAELACRTAVKLRELMEKREAEWMKRFGRRIAFRVGIATGEALVGELGSDLKSNFTAVGEPVTRAWRVEQANELYGTYLLTDERTAAIAGREFAFREVDRVALRGTPQRLFQLVGRADGLSGRERVQVRDFEEARKLYAAREFQQALVRFGQIDEDPVAALYVERCRDLIRTPPPPDWEDLTDPRSRSA